MKTTAMIRTGKPPDFKKLFPWMPRPWVKLFTRLYEKHHPELRTRRK